MLDDLKNLVGGGAKGFDVKGFQKYLESTGVTGDASDAISKGLSLVSSKFTENGLDAEFEKDECKSLIEKVKGEVGKLAGGAGGLGNLGNIGGAVSGLLGGSGGGDILKDAVSYIKKFIDFKKK